MPSLIIYRDGRPVHPARRVRTGEDVDALIEAALAAGASRVRLISRSTGREMLLVEAHDEAPRTG